LKLLAQLAVFNNIFVLTADDIGLRNTATAVAMIFSRLKTWLFKK